MRKPTLAVVAIVTALLTGCSGEPDGTEAPAGAVVTPAVAGTTPATSGPAEPPTDTALSEDTAAVCAQAARTSESFSQTLAEDRRLLTQVAGEGAEAKARAKEKAGRDVANFSYALADMSRLVADPAVKKALAAMGAEVAAAEGDIAGIDEKKLRSTLDKACG